MASFARSPLRIGMVAGEASGDLLAAGLLKELKQRGIPFLAEGIAGPEMQKQGCLSLFPMDRLSVMGLGEIFRQLPSLLRLRYQLAQYFTVHPPDIFIGVDAPEFNLSLEKKLKEQHIPTVHYVSPSVWAWRRWRLKKIARSIDLMLSLFPFEQHFYHQHRIPVHYVGHPFADEIPFDPPNKFLVRQHLNLPHSGPIIALLPGSRSNELHYLGELFLKTAQYCHQQNPELNFVLAALDAEGEAKMRDLANTMVPQLPLCIIQGQSRQVMAAADLILLASGTATLEAMLLKKPMVVAYRMSILSYCLAKCLIKVDHIALPNLLVNKALVPEFIQEKATLEKLSQALFYYLNHPDSVIQLQKEFLTLHQTLSHNASKEAVDAVLRLLRA